MAKYVYIKKTNKKGELGISKSVFKQIGEESIHQINGIISLDNKKKTFLTDDDVDVTLRENEAIFKIKVNISKDVNKDEIETKIKEVLTNNLLYLLDAVPFKIVIKTNII